MYKKLSFLVVGLIISTFTFANNIAEFYNQGTNLSSFKMKIKGDSNIKLWESDVTKINGSSNFAENEISMISLDIEVKGIKSGKDGMDEKTYDALNADKHPNISYTFIKVVSINEGKIVTEGYLKINGVTKKEQIESEFKVEGNKLILKGSQKVKMSDFNVSPPTALLGTIRCKDEIEIEYEFNFSK